MVDLQTDITSTFKYFKDTPVLRTNGKEYVIEGPLHCCVKDYEELYDVFNVIIVVPFYFPKLLPTVIEKDGKIQRTKEYHIDEKGKCCLGTNIALFDYMHTNKILTFNEFLQQIIIIHFLNMKHFLAKGQWLERPEAHYTGGLIDSYKRIFNLTERDLEKTLSPKFKKYDKCLCKRRRFDKCHGRYIPVEQVQQDFRKMMQNWRQRDC